MKWIKIIVLLLTITIPASSADLSLERCYAPGQWIYGILKVDDLTIHTIENTKTLIPLGTHKIIMTYSPRFKKKTPEILIENREGIRIHAVGKKFALEGCIGISPADYKLLLAKLDKHNTITISVAKPVPPKLTYFKILLDKLTALKIYLYRYAKMLHLSY